MFPVFGLRTGQSILANRDAIAPSASFSGPFGPVSPSARPQNSPPTRHLRRRGLSSWVPEFRRETSGMKHDGGVEKILRKPPQNAPTPLPALDNIDVPARLHGEPGR